MLGIVGMIIAVVVSRMVNEIGFRRLTAEEKIRLIDGFATTRLYSMLPILAALALFWILSTQTSLDQTILSACFIGVILIYHVALMILNQRTLGRLDLPQNYRRTFLISQLLGCIGLVWLIVALPYG